jgi:16S rRNA processing protein RimM
MADALWDDLVVVARVARTHGRRGEVILNPETDFPEERFRMGQSFRASDRAAPLIVRSVWFHKSRPVVGFEGVDTMNDAEELAGLELRVPVEALAPLPPGVFYHHDLVGCRVESPEGAEIGVVTRVDGNGAASRLVVDTASGEELIPLVQEMCPLVDPKARRIVVAAPDGLLGLNVTARRERVRRDRVR